jgi:hypothetical protein
MKQRKNEPKVERAYTYRRELHRSDLLPALGAGFAVGAIAFYVATLFIQRTPLVPGPLEPTGRLRSKPGAGRREDDRESMSREGSRAARVRV